MTAITFKTQRLEKLHLFCNKIGQEGAKSIANKLTALSIMSIGIQWDIFSIQSTQR
jgi:hypothetical protein